LAVDKVIAVLKGRYFMAHSVITAWSLSRVGQLHVSLP